ncbi:Gfo/Idh/MocA family protein [Thermoanaerobacter indiensis]|uniref:Gfo/Idh/MocA family protein n=1 Tax=Thermoanaerobacter indiensis TaxID=1125974 RepID=UPI000361DE87|nr:Gfo/Idh/MocA family oxidoreductase [Thermoanaerobacter indiensis]
MEKLKVAIIGAGSIAEIGHLPYYKNHPKVQLVAIVDKDLKRAQYMQEKYSIHKIYSSFEEMVNDIKVDAVSICTPNVDHFPIAWEALNRGIHILVEKPLTTTYEEALKLQKIAIEKKCVAMVGMIHRFRNDVKALKKYVETGELGDIYYAKAKILRRRGTPRGWFTDKGSSGGGALMDIGVHALDLAWWLAGSPLPISVSGHLVKGIGPYNTDFIHVWRSAIDENNNLGKFDVEDFATAFIRFEKGLVIHLEVSWAINGPQDEGLKVELYGTKGGLTLEPLAFYYEKNNVFNEMKLVVNKNNPFEEEINHFVDSILNGTVPNSSIEDGVEVVKMLEAIMKSSESKEEIKFI